MGNTCYSCGFDNRDSAKFCNECGQTLGISVSLQNGAILGNGRYITKRFIKHGGMGSVYEVIDTNSNKIFAVKELSLSLSNERNYLLSRFETEAKLLSHLEHINLPKVYDYFTDNDNCYLVMDFVDGKDLATLLHQRGNPGLPQEEVVKCGIQICDILEYLHNFTPPVIYRDLKPSNIMLRSSDKRIILIDFGIACFFEGNYHGNPRTMIGTMGYIAPEQYMGKPVPASDIYSLGCTLYNLLTGSMPVPFSYKPMRTIVPEIASGIEEIVSHSVSLKVKQRYQTAKEVRMDLEKVLESEILSLRTIKEKRRLYRWKLTGELPELYDIAYDNDGVFDEDFIEITMNTDENTEDISDELQDNGSNTELQYEEPPAVFQEKDVFLDEIFDEFIEEHPGENDEYISDMQYEDVIEEDFITEFPGKDAFFDEIFDEFIEEHSGKNNEHISDTQYEDVIEEDFITEFSGNDTSFDEIFDEFIEEHSGVKSEQLQDMKNEDVIKELSSVDSQEDKEIKKEESVKDDININASQNNTIPCNLSFQSDIYRDEEARKYFEAAQKLIEEKRYEEAVSLCEKALYHNVESLEIHYTLGNLYKQLNCSELSVECYKKYLALKQKKRIKITGKKISNKPI